MNDSNHDSIVPLVSRPVNVAPANAGCLPNLTALIIRSAMKDPGRYADLLVEARRCHTLSASPGRPQAVAVSEGRVFAVGTTRRLRSLVSRRTRVVRLPEATITPGLIDAHTHFFYWAMLRALVIDLAGSTSLEEALARIRRQARRKRVGEWVLGSGFDHNLWGGGFPTARDLDQAVPDLPAIVRSRDTHSAWLNSAAMRRLGIGPGTPDPPGGQYLRDAHGRPTGILQEAALAVLPDPLAELAGRDDPAARRIIDRALEEAYAVARAFGLVAVHTMDDAASLRHLLRHHLEGRLGLGIVHAIPWNSLDHALALGLAGGLGDQRLKLGGVKMFVDGALGSQTALMFDSYPGRPDYFGVPVLAGEELREAVVRAARQGWPAWIHAIGDRAVHEALDAVAAARKVEPRFLVHRIEHAQCVRPADVRGMARLKVVASVQPCHLMGDIATAERHWPKACRHTYPFRRLREAGVELAGGSDVPVESPDPRRGLFAAVCRTDSAGQPPGGWFPEQRLSVLEALRAFTVGGVLAGGGRPQDGTLAPGAPANMTLWGEDPLRMSPEDLPDIPILGVVIQGRVYLTSEP